MVTRYAIDWTGEGGMSRTLMQENVEESAELLFDTRGEAETHIEELHNATPESGIEYSIREVEVPAPPDEPTLDETPAEQDTEEVHTSETCAGIPEGMEDCRLPRDGSECPMWRPQEWAPEDAESSEAEAEAEAEQVG